MAIGYSTNFKCWICKEDAKTRFVEKLNTTVTEFRVVRYLRNKRTGEDIPRYYKIVGFGEQYAKMAKFLKLKRHLELSGELTAEGYLSEETNKVVTYLQMNNPYIEFLDKKPEDDAVPEMPTSIPEEVPAEVAEDDKPF